MLSSHLSAERVSVVPKLALYPCGRVRVFPALVVRATGLADSRACASEVAKWVLRALVVPFCA